MSALDRGPKWQSYQEFMADDWPEPDNIVEEWLPTAGLALLFGPRGGGKTFVSLQLAICVAAGWPFLDMAVPKPRKVLYVDGEMQANKVVKRLRKLEKGQGPYPPWFSENFRYLSHELFEFGIPDLSSDRHDPVVGKKGRRLIEDASEDRDLVILDNMSSLLKSVIENEAEGWKDVLAWCLGFRRKRKTVLLIHHTGKSKGAGGEFTSRGSGAKEDLLDTVVKLETTDAEKGKPIEINWKFTKWRHFQPEKPIDLEVAFSGQPEDTAVIRLADDPLKEVDAAVKAQSAAGASVRQIAEATGKSKSRVQRQLRRLKGDTRPAREL